MLNDSFISLQVDTEGEFNNSARILELTRPLSQHKISLFFLSNHFTNIVLIPLAFQDKVIEILTHNSFEISDVSNSYIANGNTPDLAPSDFADLPLAVDVRLHALQLLKDAHVKPKIHRKMKLLLTGARPGEVKQSILKTLQCIASNNVPEYFAITRSSLSEISLILPGSSRKRAAMGFDFRSIIGSTSDAIIPITVDLTKLPLDTTGIVAGLASSLLHSMKTIDESMTEELEMSYLSMARSAVIMIPQENLDVVTKMVKSMDMKLVSDLSALMQALST